MMFVRSETIRGIEFEGFTDAIEPSEPSLLMAYWRCYRIILHREGGRDQWSVVVENDIASRISRVVIRNLFRPAKKDKIVAGIKRLIRTGDIHDYFRNNQRRTAKDRLSSCASLEDVAEAIKEDPTPFLNVGLMHGSHGSPTYGNMLSLNRIPGWYFETSPFKITSFFINEEQNSRRNCFKGYLRIQMSYDREQLWPIYRRLFAFGVIDTSEENFISRFAPALLKGAGFDHNTVPGGKRGYYWSRHVNMETQSLELSGDYVLSNEDGIFDSILVYRRLMQD